MPRAKSKAEIQSRRTNSSVDAIMGKQLNDRAHGKERALVRVGVRNTDILTGKDDLSTWTTEELRRGQRMDKNGGWRGVAPVVVPKALHDELVRRTLSEAERIMRDDLVAAVKVLGEIAQDKNADEKARLTAVKLIMDRVMGREPVHVEVNSKAKWELALEGGIVSLKDAIDPEPS